MIIFDLICSNRHSFEGWFQSQNDFDIQLERGLISCPYCESVEIRRVPSAIHLAKPTSDSTASNDVPVISPQADAVGNHQKLISAILTHCEDVGTEFTQEARRIYYKEAPERSIRGQASEEDFQALREEGIEVMKLPVIKKGKMN